MSQIIGWAIWSIVVFLAISFAFGCRTYAKTGRGFQWATGILTFFLWFIAVLFLVSDWNKFHILWVVPMSFFAATFLASRGIPILSPLVLFATRVFLNIVLIGVPPTNEDLQWKR